VRSGQEEFTIRVNDDWEATGILDASAREREILADGGKLTHVKQQYEEEGGAASADD
jgi:aconitate hydratase